MTPNRPALERLLGQIFDHCQEGLQDEISPSDYEKQRHDFVFHMLDWYRDLEHLSRLYHDPEGQDVQSVSRFLVGFLYHVIPHLNAAGRLLLDQVPDPFAAGASTPTVGNPSQGPR
jgi:hypothetical protein